jgi:hypothetical protein
MIARGPRRSSSGCRLIFGCILAALLGGTTAVAQSPIPSTKPLTTPGLNQPLLVPPATTPKNSQSPTGSGLGLGAQSVPGILPVTNPQASKGGSDAEKIDKAEPSVTVRGFDKLDRLTRGRTAEPVTKSTQDKSKSAEQKAWLPSNFRPTPPLNKPVPTAKDNKNSWGDWYIDRVPVGEAGSIGGKSSGGTGTKTGASTGTGTGGGGSTSGKSQSENQDGDKQSQSSQKPSQ